MNRTSDLSGFETSGFAPSNANNENIKIGADRSQQSAVGTPDYLAPEILLGSKHGENVIYFVIIINFVGG